jgi:hypothetical protein
MPAADVGRGRNYVRRRDNLERAFERDEQTVLDPGLPSRGARNPQPWYAGPKPPADPPPRRLLDQAPLTPTRGRPARRGKGQPKVSPTRAPTDLQTRGKVREPTPRKGRPVEERPREADLDSAKPAAKKHASTTRPAMQAPHTPPPTQGPSVAPFWSMVGANLAPPPCTTPYFGAPSPKWAQSRPLAPPPAPPCDIAQRIPAPLARPKARVQQRVDLFSPTVEPSPTEMVATEFSPAAQILESVTMEAVDGLQLENSGRSSSSGARASSSAAVGAAPCSAAVASTQGQQDNISGDYDDTSACLDFLVRFLSAQCILQFHIVWKLFELIALVYMSGFRSIR